MSEQWMSIVEYARTFAISDMTVRRRIKNGKLPAVLRDGKYYIKVDGGQQQPAYSHDAVRIEESAAASLESEPSTFRPAHPVMASPATYPASRNHLSQDEYRGSPSETLRTMVPDPRSQSFKPAPASPELSDLIRRSLEKLESSERQIRDSFQSKLVALEERIRLKDLEIHRLREQVADLQTLVNMIQSKP